MSKKQKGFTLIELLVVISIIGLLGTLAMTSINNARMKARDTKRMADLKQIQKALDLYYDTNKAYPMISQARSYYNALTPGTGTVWTGAGSLGTALAPYMQNLPKDPMNNSNTQEYRYDSKPAGLGVGYGLAINLEGTYSSYPEAADGGIWNTMYETGPDVSGGFDWWAL